MAKFCQRVKSLAHLKTLSSGGAEFFLVLKFGLVSYKHVTWDERRKRFKIVNRIAGTKQSLTEKQMMSRAYTNIGYALTRKALFEA